MLRQPVLALLSAALLLPGAIPAAWAQNPGQPRNPPISAPGIPQPSGIGDPQSELRTGSNLTRQGYLQQAIPHLLAAQSAGLDPYAVGVNLGICYLGTGQYSLAISVLRSLDASGSGTAAVDNLLSQAYVANAQPQEAWNSFLRAAAFNPKDEKLYAFLADACTDHKDYDLGLRIVNSGLVQLPASARLHYERALFLARMGSFDEARPGFDRAAQLAPGSYIGYLAQVQKALYGGSLATADKILHEAIQAGNRDYRILSLLGTVLLHEGAMPGEPRFDEAQTALEESAREQPDYSATQIALGKLFLMQGDARQAVAHLEIGRRMEPEDASVYPNLADAYELLGDRDKARTMREQLGRILADQQKEPRGGGQPAHR